MQGTGNSPHGSSALLSPPLKDFKGKEGSGAKGEDTFEFAPPGGEGGTTHTQGGSALSVSVPTASSSSGQTLSASRTADGFLASVPSLTTILRERELERGSEGSNTPR